MKNNYLKLDLGSGLVKRNGFLRIDNNEKCHPDIIQNMQEYVHSVPNDSVEVIICSHAMEFLTGEEIYDFMNECHRILIKDGVMFIMVTSVTIPNGLINPKAWTVPLLKTHFSPETFRIFNDQTTLELRNLKPWDVIIKHKSSGELLVKLNPKK